MIASDSAETMRLYTDGDGDGVQSMELERHQYLQRAMCLLLYGVCLADCPKH